MGVVSGRIVIERGIIGTPKWRYCARFLSYSGCGILRMGAMQRRISY